MLFGIGLLLLLTVILFNEPKLVVPPSYRGEPGRADAGATERSSTAPNSGEREVPPGDERKPQL